MNASDRKTIAVFGASGHQGGGVVRALQADGRFKVRALTRDPARHADLAEEVVAADLNAPEDLEQAFEGVHGLFLVTNFWEEGTDEHAQAVAAVRAAKGAGVRHFIWSTLPDVEAISGGKFHVPHFTNKARIDQIVAEAGFEHYHFVLAPFFYQNLTGSIAPQQQQDGSLGWTLPIDPDVGAIHMGDIGELGIIVAGAFADPDRAANGSHLPLVGDFMSFSEIVTTLGRLGHDLTFNQVPREVFATFFPGAGELADMFGYFEAHTYLGSDMTDAIALANQVAGRMPTRFADWARIHFRPAMA
jgi:uncharacterized protein YbjT (DUF2867 family)